MTMKANGLLTLLLTGAVSCVGHGQDNSEKTTSGEDPPLVAFCRSIDYTDTATLHEGKSMKRMMTGVVKMMHTSDSISTSTALSILFNGLKHDRESIDEAVRLAELYLNNPSSPARDETLYIRMMKSLLDTDSIPEDIRLRQEEKLRKASINRPGTTATDFRYVDRNGKSGSLHTFEAPQTMLIFYDPECSHCSAILHDIASHSGINNAITTGKLRVLAVYAEGKRDVWNKTKGDMPKNWSVGYDLSGILDHDLYDLPAMPLIYLLDNHHRVILKDPDPARLLKNNKL